MQKRLSCVHLFHTFHRKGDKFLSMETILKCCESFHTELFTLYEIRNWWWLMTKFYSSRHKKYFFQASVLVFIGCCLSTIMISNFCDSLTILKHVKYLTLDRLHYRGDLGRLFIYGCLCPRCPKWRWRKILVITWPCGICVSAYFQMTVVSLVTVCIGSPDIEVG